MAKKAQRMTSPMPPACHVKLQASDLKAAMKGSQVNNEAISEGQAKRKRVGHEMEIPWTDGQAIYIETIIKPETMVNSMFETLDKNSDLVHAGINIFQNEDYGATGAYRGLRILRMKKKIDNLTTYLKGHVASNTAVSATVSKSKPNLDKIIWSFMDFMKPITAKQNFEAEHKAEISHQAVVLVAAAKKGDLQGDSFCNKEEEEVDVSDGLKD
ncbi:hypothetical protein ARMSODRAFT_1023333 [Armillaria solidipes]|uniref:Uncharacterized protein n=1 Tax=Armillaria solidipes TaxID=1076256 RepID=A0A2H3BM90_9AGAR|nr:hypothetical protein ARMSODRAFT_1023333 [Armillaria solidipes]